jgi:hypothetical protein
MSRGAGKVADANTPDEDWRGVVGVAYRSHPSIGDERLTRLDDEDSLPMHDPAVMLRLGVETAALDAAAAAPLRALLASVSVAEPPRSPQGRFAIDSFAPLAPWLAAAVGLPPERQAGALFAADVVLRLASQRGLLPVDSVSRARFEALGADFVFGRDRQYAYGGAFRRRAFELHAPGVLGDTLFAMYIQRARPCMALGRIIDEAERRLGITRASATRAAVHLVAARALADSFVYTGSAVLRERALVHYQAALQEAPQGHDVLRRAWQEGWRLAVGLAPLRLRYYCSRPD